MKLLNVFLLIASIFTQTKLSEFTAKVTLSIVQGGERVYRTVKLPEKLPSSTIYKKEKAGISVTLTSSADDRNAPEFVAISFVGKTTRVFTLKKVATQYSLELVIIKN